MVETISEILKYLSFKGDFEGVYRKNVLFHSQIEYLYKNLHPKRTTKILLKVLSTVKK